MIFPLLDDFSGLSGAEISAVFRQEKQALESEKKKKAKHGDTVEFEEDISTDEEGEGASACIRGASASG